MEKGNKDKASTDDVGIPIAKTADKFFAFVIL